MNPSKIYRNLSRHELRSAVIGMVLGDANLQMRATNARIQISHKPAVEDYVQLKGFVLGQVPGLKFKYTPVIHKNRKLDREYPQLRVWTGVHPFLTEMRDRLYKPKKRVTRGLLSSLTDLGFAFWFMDDGHLSLHHNKKRYATEVNSVASERSICARNYVLNTHGFSYEEQELICSWLKSRYGVAARIKKEKRGGTFFIFVNTTNARILCDVVRPYVLDVPSMHYKIDFRYVTDTSELLRYNIDFWTEDCVMEEGQESGTSVNMADGDMV